MVRHMTELLFPIIGFIFLICNLLVIIILLKEVFDMTIRYYCHECCRRLGIFQVKIYNKKFVGYNCYVADFKCNKCNSINKIEQLSDYHERIQIDKEQD